MELVTIGKFKELYENDQLEEVFAVGNTVYGKTSSLPPQTKKKIVYAVVP